MVTALSQLVTQDKKISDLICKDELEGEDLLGALMAQNKILKKANQEADRLRGKAIDKSRIVSIKIFLAG